MNRFLFTEAPTADFSQDNGWVVLGKALGIFVLLLVGGSAAVFACWRLSRDWGRATMV